MLTRGFLFGCSQVGEEGFPELSKYTARLTSVLGLMGSIGRDYNHVQFDRFA